jgi:hypothetical protein
MAVPMWAIKSIMQLRPWGGRKETEFWKKQLEEKKDDIIYFSCFY